MVKTIPIAETALCVAPKDMVKLKVVAIVLLSRKYRIVSGRASEMKIKTKTLIKGPMISCPIVRPLAKSSLTVISGLCWISSYRLEMMSVASSITAPSTPSRAWAMKIPRVSWVA